MTQPQTSTPRQHRVTPVSVRLRHRSLWVRVLSVVLSLVWLGVVFVVGGFFTIASPVGGWLYATLCFLPGLVGTAFLFGVTRWRDVLLAAAAVSLVCGVAMYQQVPPDHGRIRSIAEDVGVPVDGWQLVYDSERGNTWCWKGCPEVTYLYAAPQDPADALTTLGNVLEEDGWRGGAQDPTHGLARSEYTPLAEGTWRKGRWEVSLSVPAPASHDRLTAEAAQRGLTPVEVSFDGS